MTSPNEKLLSAENAVQDLLIELVELKKQIGGYANATNTLNEVINRLNQLIVRTEELSVKALEGILVLKEIGTPEILRQLELIEESLDDLKIKINLIEASQKSLIFTQTEIISKLVKVNIAISITCLMISVVTVSVLFFQ